MAHHRIPQHSADGTPFQTALVITAALVALKALGGIWSHSLALEADAVHSLGDAAALGLAWYADKVHRRPPTTRLTFGWGRTEVLIGLLNAVVLWILAAVFIVEAWVQWHHPAVANAPLMAITSALALLMNGLLAGIFRHPQDLNRRSAYWHLLTDAAGSFGVLVAAVVLGLTGWAPVNAVMTVAIAVLMVWGAWGVVRDTVRVLLEGTPSSFPLVEITQRMESVTGVHHVHDLHVWSVGSTQLALACHVTLQEQESQILKSQDILCDLHDVLAAYGIHHTTIQLETGVDVHPEPPW